MNEHHVDILSVFPDQGNGQSTHISCSGNVCKYLTVDLSNGDLYVTSVTAGESFARIKFTPEEFRSLSLAILEISNTQKELPTAV